jgi:hypothetical protein
MAATAVVVVQGKVHDVIGHIERKYDRAGLQARR